MSGIMQADAGLRTRDRDGDDDAAWLGGTQSGEVTPTLSAMLRKTIESEVIPRLMLLNQSHLRVVSAASAEQQTHVAITPEAVLEFAHALIRLPPADAVKRGREYLSRGVSSERLLLDLLAPAARALGDMWTEDEASFTEVSAGLSRLHQLLRMISEPGQSPDEGECGHILLASMPGDRHVFGLAMVEEFFRDAGWSVVMLSSVNKAAILDAVSSAHFEVVGLSLAREELQSELSSLIDTIRRDSLNRGLRVLVGGPVFLNHPERCAAVGADATAADGRQAVIEARSLLRLSAAMR